MFVILTGSCVTYAFLVVTAITTNGTTELQILLFNLKTSFWYFSFTFFELSAFSLLFRNRKILTHPKIVSLKSVHGHGLGIMKKETWLKQKSDLFLFFVNTGTLFKKNISIAKVSMGWKLYTFFCAVYFYWVANLCQVAAYSLELRRGHCHNSIILLVLNTKHKQQPVKWIFQPLSDSISRFGKKKKNSNWHWSHQVKNTL